MPITVFENSRDETLTLTIEPSDRKFALHPLARIGVRYAFADGAPEWTQTDFGTGSITFWCDAEDIEVEIVHPTAFDRLLWHLCVIHGCCGAEVDGKFIHVTDLLPASGIVTAEQFAELAADAEGYSREDALRKRSLPRFEALFREHMGADRVSAEALIQTLAQPFD